MVKCKKPKAPRSLFLRTLIARHTQKNTVIRTSASDSVKRDAKSFWNRGSAIRAAWAFSIQDSTRRGCPILCSRMSVA